MLKNIKKLSEIKEFKDIVPLSKALYPGSHCPLFGATLILKSFNDSAVIILGTQECTYYTKSMILSNDKFYNRCFSVITDQNDITFGSANKVEQAIKELFLKETPKSVFIVTTCVIEVTGDDIDSIALNLTKEYNVPIMVVHTEHFRCDSHMSGMTSVLAQTTSIMKECEKEKCVNILGHRHNNFNESELYKILEENNISINLNLPAICDTDTITNASKAMLNIVCDDIGLELAERMKEKFDIPFVVLSKSCNVETIFNVYKTIFSTFNIEMPNKIIELKENAEQTLKEMKKSLTNVTYIYGNTPINTFEIIGFLTKMGMVAKLIQIKEIKESDFKVIEYLKSVGQDPYITKSANIAPLQSVYDELKPDFYIGHENPTTLAKKGIIQIALDSAGEKIGFEMPLFVAKMLTMRYEMKKEVK